MMRSNQPLFFPSRYRVCVPLQAVIISVTPLLAILLASRILPPELGRILLAGLFAFQLCFELRHGERNFLLSPAFLLAFVVLMAFSIMPNFFHQVLGWFDPLEVPSDENLYLALPRLVVMSYFGSQAESWILTFSAVGLTLHASIRILCGNAIENSPATGIGRDYYRTFMLAFSALFTTLFIFQTQTVFFSSSMTAFFQTFFGPIQSFVLLFLLHLEMSRKQSYRIRVLLLFCAAVVAMVLAKQFKVPILMILSAIIYYIATVQISFRRVISTILLCVFLFVFILQLVGIVRDQGHGNIEKFHRLSAEKLSALFISKVVWRQTETGFCFNNVLRSHADDDFNIAKQTFWLKILVPRVLWPEKPNFSQGAEYAVNYCKMPTLTSHSASITLLGQPVIEGGVPGLLVHGSILLFFLGGATALAFRRPGLTRVVVFALLPWWIDFDQDFALYFGNIVKFGLCITPLMLISSVSLKQRSISSAGRLGY
ncbi:MAG: hypothetical protein VXX97_00940 [Pseudomonadota bacterium]|nr:hypothetical protein [Pseudomonadota bacterium]